MDHMRLILAANLNRAADNLDRLAATINTKSAKKDDLGEMQAETDAGLAVWEATIRGFLDVPEITMRVAELAECGFSEPTTAHDNGAECANLFFCVMSDYIYSLGEAVTPYQLSASDDHEESDIAEYYRARQSELRSEATGCRVLARLIETEGAGNKTDKPTDFIANALQQQILAVLKGEALKKQPLADAVCAGEGTRLYRKGGIKELMEAGLVAHKNGIGYFRPDAPPDGLVIPRK